MILMMEIIVTTRYKIGHATRPDLTSLSYKLYKIDENDMKTIRSIKTLRIS